MKNKNHNSKLMFAKTLIVELNDNQLTEINGGTSIDWPSTGCLCTWVTRTINDQLQ